MTTPPHEHARSAAPSARRAGRAGLYTRRAALGALAAGGAAFALFGPRAERARAHGRIVLDYWEKWTQHEGAAMKAVVDAFNESQSRILVRYIVASAIEQKAIIAIGGGSPPDVIGLYAYNVPPFAEQRALMPLDALAPSHGVRLDDYKPSMRTVMTHAVPGVPERWWGVVSTAGTIAMYARRDLLREVGWDPDRPPRTIAELDECHARLLKRDASGRIERVGFLHCEPGWWNWMWPYAFGGSIYDAATDRATVASPAGVRAYDWVQRYPRSLGVEPIGRFFDGFRNAIFAPGNSFITGKVAMVLQGPWMGNIIEQFGPGTDYTVAPMPTEAGADPRAPAGLIDTDVMVIPRGARHPDASMEFIAFAQRPDMVKTLATRHFKINPLLAPDEAFERTHPNRGIAVHNAIAASPASFTSPRTRAFQQMRDEADQSMHRIWRLERGCAPAEELPRLQAAMQAAIDRVAEARRRRYGDAA